jgi:hypothetical protein
VFYVALGYFISYLPCALLAKALSSGIVPGVDRPVGGLVLLPAAALGQLLAMPIFLGVSGWWRFASEQRVGSRRRRWPGRDTVVAALCRWADAIYRMTVDPRATVLALAPDGADRTHCLADSDIPEPAAASSDDHRHIAALIQQAVQKRLAERFL